MNRYRKRLGGITNFDKFGLINLVIVIGQKNVKLIINQCISTRPTVPNIFSLCKSYGRTLEHDLEIPRRSFQAWRLINYLIRPNNKILNDDGSANLTEKGLS